MNAVEIEEAVSQLAEASFDPEIFPFAFLEAFGNKPTTIQRLKSTGSSSTNQSDIPGGVLQRNNIHIKVCIEGEVSATLTALRESSATARNKVKFILATDGKTLEAENLNDGETIVCAYSDLANHFGFFLPLAGITTVKQIRENAFDIKATGRLNRLYVELLKDNPDWESRQEDFNHFMARLIFCFFAEDTGVFNCDGLFTDTIAKMSSQDSSNTHEVLSEIFRAMCTLPEYREANNIRRWADAFPYVNGGLFSGSVQVPRFSRIARSYLLHIGSLDWKKINPDIFGSMIQAVADEQERGALGMHYTSVPNILKVLNPLFLDDLRTQLDEAGNNSRKLLNLRQRMARIRVFDPACGSGNFLVIAYKEMRAIEAEINHRRGEQNRKSEIPLTNFRGIEIRHFAAEIARLALVIAEYQCNAMYLGQLEAKTMFLPLARENWIICGNALRLDWLSVCPPTGTGVRLVADDLFNTPLNQTELDFENEGGETYICGNPPYRGSQWQTKEQKDDLKQIFEGRTKKWGSLDYVSGWFMKASDYGTQAKFAASFVSTNSICQGRQVETLWSLILNNGQKIAFAYTSFKWANLASYNAGVTVVIVGISNNPNTACKLYSIDSAGETIVRQVPNINPYLISGQNIIVQPVAKPISDLGAMNFGNMPNEGGLLLLTQTEANDAIHNHKVNPQFIRPFVGSQEFIRGQRRYCIWVSDNEYSQAKDNAWLNSRFESVRSRRMNSSRETTRLLSDIPYRFGEVRQRGDETAIIVPAISSEIRDYLPCGLVPPGTIVSNKCYALYNAPLWNLALIASRLHWVWISTVCVRLRTDFSYSNTLGWNTFPVPTFTEQNKTDLTRCAEDILLAREYYFPATIADMYDPNRMDTEFPLVREAHEKNDETLERIYIGRRFRNDTERLEKLFEMYVKMTSQQSQPRRRRIRGAR